MSSDLTILWISMVFFAYAITFTLLEFNRERYDWDIDHEMYFGQALLRGDLIWTSEFHDKLPLVQFFFAIPAYFESVTVWRVISLAFAGFSAMTLYHFSPLILSESRPSPRATGLLATGIFLTLIVFMPGGLTHINVVPTSSALVALVLMFIFFNQKAGIKRLTGLSILIALFATISISFRPYFLFALVPAGIWMAIKFMSQSNGQGVGKRFAMASALAVTIIVIGFGVNVFPYALSGQMGDFLDGLGFLLQDKHPRPALDTFIGHFRQGSPSAIITVGALLLGLFWTSYAKVRNRKFPRFSGLIVFSFFTLALGILTQHWWPHYANLFSWHIAIIVALLIAEIVNTLAHLTPRREKWSRLYLAFAFVFVAGPVLAYGTLQLVRTANYPIRHPEEWRPQAISTYLQENSNGSLSFISPEDMYSHWKLNEPRYGFPHAANTAHISKGWWAETPDTQAFLAPNDSIEYCELLYLSSIDIVFVKPSGFLADCLRSAGDLSSLQLQDKIVENDGQLEVWSRSP